MPRKKGASGNVSRKSATPQSGKRGPGRPPSGVRASQRSATVKKVAQSKQKRSSAGRGTTTKDRKNPWEESDDEAAYNHELFSDSEYDSDADETNGKGVKAELSSEDSDFEFRDGNPTVFIEDLSTKIFCPWAELEPDKIPKLILPCSSSDLLIDKDHIFDALEIYEILRAYCHTIQISPFLFEDFCSALRSSIQSKLLCEIHIALLKLLFRDDEEDQTLYSVQDTNNSFNILLALIEPMTFAEVLRQYVESDASFSSEILHILNTTNYPFVDLEKRLIVLKFLCERFFDTVIFKRLINRENKIIHDEHCRDCGRQGDVLLCDGCEACYHLKCTNLAEIPHGKWLCQICEVHEVNGVANCLMPGERDCRFSRRTQPLGFDRHGRIYWFLARRVFVQNVETKELHYYSSLPQIYELMSVLDDHLMEEVLFRSLTELLPTIADHMRITLELTDERRKNLQEKMQRESPRPYLHVDNTHRMSQIITSVVQSNGDHKQVTNGEWELKLGEEKSVLGRKSMKMLKELLGIEDGRLAATLWSGGCSEYELLDYHCRLANGAAPTYGKMNGHGNTLEDFQVLLLENVQRGYRLGFSDAEYRNYVNHYSISDFAKSPYTRAKERDRRRYLCSKFSLIDEGEFSWICAKGRDCFASEHDVAKWIQFTLRRLLERLTDDLMHRSWRYEEKSRFQEFLQNSVTVNTLKRALLQFECAVRKPIFCPVWWNSLGHTRLLRLTAEERERRQKVDVMRKKEEKALISADANDEDYVWVKYSMYKNGPPRHNIWRLKDEQYRVNARDKMGGWLWISSTYKRVVVPVPKRPQLGISYATPKKSIAACEDMQAHYLDKIVRYLSTRRVINEMVKTARSASRPCYSPSCRMVARGDRMLVSALSITYGCFRSCYSPSCPRRVYESCEFNTAEVVKAFKPFKPNPYAITGKTKDCRPEETVGEGKAFPLPRVFDYLAKKTKKRSILILPKKSLRRLARQGGLNGTTYIPGYHKMSKNNYQVWNYPCPRPLFDNCWRYLTVSARSLHALALQLRIIYACIRWADFEPAERDDEDSRVWTHHPDSDEVRSVINHKEFPPDGYYEQYKIRVERYALQDDLHDEIAAADDDDSADYKTTSVKTLRKRKRKNQKPVQEEVYVKRRRTSMEEKWVDGVELKLYEIVDYWARYFTEKRRRYEEFKQRQQEAHMLQSPSSRPLVCGQPMRMYGYQEQRMRLLRPQQSNEPFQQRQHCIQIRQLPHTMYSSQQLRDNDQAWRRASPAQYRGSSVGQPSPRVVYRQPQQYNSPMSRLSPHQEPLRVPYEPHARSETFPQQRTIVMRAHQSQQQQQSYYDNPSPYHQQPTRPRGLQSQPSQQPPQSQSQQSQSRLYKKLYWY